MDKDTVFKYSYCAATNREVQEIRKKYLPREESKLEELKRLDSQVQEAGVLISLVLGIGGFLVFGLGICMTLDIITGGIILGVLLAILGSAGMIAAYPAGLIRKSKVRTKLTPRILQLTEEMMQGIVNTEQVQIHEEEAQ